MEVLKGAAVSAAIRQEIEEGLKKLNGRIPTLAIIRVGDRPDDCSYERGATKKLENLGLQVKSCVFPQEISHEEFREAFLAVNRDPQIQGILLLRPLPKQIDEREIERLIDPGKDLDGISPVNIAKVFSGDKEGFAPCTAEAVIRLLKTYRIPIEGKEAVVVGRSMVVGRPLSMLLLKENATVTICHTKTADLKRVCAGADLLVAAAGQARMITGEYVKEGAVVIDVGIHVDPEGHLMGDAAFETLEGKASMATPVPGGVGAVTTGVLAEHLIRAALAS